MKRDSWYVVALGLLGVIAGAGWGEYFYLKYQLRQEYRGYVQDARTAVEHLNKMAERDLREIDRLQKEAAAEEGKRRK